MGCNYYLKKKNGESWTLPNNRLGNALEFLCKKEFDEGGSISLSIDLKACIGQINELHIGKSSFGWHFSLCIYPSLGIYGLEDWKKMFEDEDAYLILDEEDRVISSSEMLSTITDRKAIDWDTYSSVEEYEEKRLKDVNHILEVIEGKKQPYLSYDEFLRDNHATRGYNGLMAHASSIWDERGDEAWKEYLPIITIYISTSGTYDLTPDWDFS